MFPKTPSKKIYFAIFFIVVLLYSSSLFFDFTYDDNWQIVQSPQISSESSYISLFQQPSPPGNLYRPLTLLTFKITKDLFSLNPLLFHLENILLFGICCLLVLWLFKSIVSTTMALMGTLLFALHPIHIEAVANITGRGEILAAIFGLLGILCLHNHFQKKSFILLCGSIISLFFCVLSKESGVVFLILAPLYTYLFAPKKVLIPLLTSAVLLPIYAILRISILSNSFFLSSDGTFYAENPLFHLSFIERLYPAAIILGKNLFHILLPVSLSADYSSNLLTFQNFINSPEATGYIALLLSVVLCTLFTKDLAAKFFLLWFFVSFLTTANILTPIGTIMADRLSFTPSIGIIGFLCLFNSATQIPGYVKRFFLVCYFFMFGWLFFIRLPVWENNCTLFKQTIIDAPSSPKAYFNLGSYLFQNKLELSLAYKSLLKAHILLPNDLKTLLVLADMATQNNQLAEAIRWHKKILSLDPDNKIAIKNLEKLESLN